MAAKQEDQLEATTGSVERGDDIALTIQLHNPLPRAAHYIAEVRAISFDAAAGKVEVKLSDEGRQLIPGGISMEPRFNSVDPGADAQLTLHIPNSIMRMVPTTPPGPEVAFEEFEIGPDVEIEVSLGWSDTPFYADPRERGDDQPSSVDEWEQARARVTFRPSDG